MTRKLQTMYVQAVGDTIWFSKGTNPAAGAKTTPARFLQQHGEEADRMRLRGSAENAPLIEAMYYAKTRHGVSTAFHLCTPRVLGPDAESLFAALRELNYAGSLGGFHELSDRDGPSYALHVAMTRSGGLLNDAAAELLREHRAWPALSFIVGLDQVAAARMLCDVLDPRWFVSLQNPNSLGRLYSFLGLTPRHVENALVGRTPTCKQGRRCANVLQAWYRPSVAADPELLAHPGAYLQRIVVADPVAHSIKYFVKASRLFVAFVRDVWLDMMAAPGRRLFVPKYHFSEPTTAEAFTRHWESYAYWRSA